MILPTHKTSITYIEHCKVVAADDRLAYVKAKNGLEKHFSLPYGNTNVILLGPGTSLTHQAAYFLSSEGVLVGFVGGGQTPLYFASQNEYRPTEYLQNWYPLWENADSRLNVAKVLQIKRLEYVLSIYQKSFKSIFTQVEKVCESYREKILLAKDNQMLLGFEGNFVKNLYKTWAGEYEVNFKRTPQTKENLVNTLLDNGNYLAYGLAGSLLWILGISHSLSVSHGKTRRGGLVFDFADVIKDSTILPICFQSVDKNLDQSQFRKEATQFLEDAKALKYLFETFMFIHENAEHIKTGNIFKFI